jgi:hypothetical protein
MIDIKRRRLFFAASGFLAIPGGLFGRLAIAPDTQSEYAPLMRDLRELFADIDAALGIGEAYLNSCTSHDLTARLLHGAGVEPRRPWRVNKADFQALRDKDFEASDTILVQGWLMARAEVCACALLAHLCKGQSVR